MVEVTADADGRAAEGFANTGHIGPEGGFDVVVDARDAVFGAEDGVDEDAAEGLWHGDEFIAVGETYDGACGVAWVVVGVCVGRCPTVCCCALSGLAVLIHVVSPGVARCWDIAPLRG